MRITSPVALSSSFDAPLLLFAARGRTRELTPLRTETKYEFEADYEGIEGEV